MKTRTILPYCKYADNTMILGYDISQIFYNTVLKICSCNTTTERNFDKREILDFLDDGDKYLVYL
jgi:hypothetical protein